VNAMNDPLDYSVPLPKWIRGKKLTELTGFRLDAQKHKRIQGVWLEGVHWVKAPDGNIMYNWRAIDEWTESGYH